MRRILSGLVVLCIACGEGPGKDPGEEPGGEGGSALLYQLGSQGADYTKAAATDPSGNVAIALLFSGSITLDGKTEQLQATEGIDSAVVLYDATTGAVRTRFRFGGTGTQVPHGLAIDSAGNFAVIGYTRSAGASVANLDPARAPANARPYSGGEKPYVARYSPTGQHLWSHVLDHASAAAANDRAWDVAVDESGDIYVAGSFAGSLDLDPSAAEYVVNSNGESADIFLAKYRGSDGLFLWGFAAGGPRGDAGTEGTPVAPGGTGDLSLAVAGGAVYLQGEFRETAALHGTAAPSAASQVTSAGGTDLFVARYSAATGALERQVRLGGAGDESAAPGTLRLDSSGHLYLAGRFSGTVDLSGGAGTGVVRHTGGGSSLLLLSLKADLGFRWAAALGSSGGLDGVHRLQPDGRGGIVVAGWFNGPTDFDPSDRETRLSSNTTGAAGSDMFIARYSDAEGGFQWVTALQGEPAHGENLIIAGLAVDGRGSVWVGGQFFNPTRFGPGGRVLTPAGANDAFVARFRGTDGAPE